MSETARRIQILINLLNQDKENHVVYKEYSISDMIRNRILRLKYFGWIDEDKKGFYIKKTWPLFIFKFIDYFRFLIFNQRKL